MDNKKQYYKYRHNRKKKFYYYCHNNKPYFYRKKHKKNLENDNDLNILLQDNQLESDIESVEKNVEYKKNSEQLELISQNEQENIVLPKMPVIKMALGIIILVAVVFSISYDYFNYYNVE